MKMLKLINIRNLLTTNKIMKTSVSLIKMINRINLRQNNLWKDK